MILSVSRRTDIPRFYFEWFLNRLKEGYVLVRNPMNFHQVSRIELSPETIEFIVFWSKNPKPMIERLDELKPYPFYIQFTINAYDDVIEENLPPKKELIETFKRLSDKTSPQQILWRYSPVLLTSKYTPEYHVEFFSEICTQLNGYTEKCNLSFIDMYAKIKTRMKEMGISEPDFEQKNFLANTFKRIAAENGIKIGACGNLDLESSGIEKSQCIDGNLIAKLLNQNFEGGKDLNQREDCYCAPSIDIGTYDTCLNGCTYCYANSAKSKAEKRFEQHDTNSPILCSELTDKDKITERKMIRLFEN